jgi:hypothetical protein
MTLICFGCSRTVTGGFTDSPDKKFRMYGRTYGALGVKFIDKTRKTVRISIVASDSAETLLYRREFHIKGSDVGWDCTWDKDDNATVVIYDYPPNVYWEDAVKAGIPSNHLATVSLTFEKKTGKFRDTN